MKESELVNHLSKLSLVKYLDSEIRKTLNGNNLKGLDLLEKCVQIVKPTIPPVYEYVISTRIPINKNPLFTQQDSPKNLKPTSKCLKKMELMKWL